MNVVVTGAHPAVVFLKQFGDVLREGLMPFVFCIVLIYIGRVLIRLSRQPDQVSKINLEDLLLGDDGKMSKSAFVMMIALITTTWMMIYLTMAGQMTEGYFGLYSTAWIVPTVARLIWNPDRAQVVAPVAATVTTTTTATEVKP